jgi:hypothetical protein
MKHFLINLRHAKPKIPAFFIDNISGNLAFWLSATTAAENQ